MKTGLVILITILSLSVAHSQTSRTPQQMLQYEIEQVAEPSARLARCGRMDFAEHLIDSYVELFAEPGKIPAQALRQHIFQLSDEQYRRLRDAHWPDPRTASLECAAHTRLALERIARWHLY